MSMALGERERARAARARGARPGARRSPRRARWAWPCAPRAWSSAGPRARRSCARPRSTLDAAGATLESARASSTSARCCGAPTAAPTRASCCARASTSRTAPGRRRSPTRPRPSCAPPGAKPRRARLTGVDALTASERRVAELAAQGMTNREIAQALFVTARTVEGHLTRTFQKLDLRSRDDLAGAPRVLARTKGAVPSGGRRVAVALRMSRSTPALLRQLLTRDRLGLGRGGALRARPSASSRARARPIGWRSRSARTARWAAASASTSRTRRSSRSRATRTRRSRAGACAPRARRRASCTSTRRASTRSSTAARTAPSGRSSTSTRRWT